MINNIYDLLTDGFNLELDDIIDSLDDDGELIDELIECRREEYRREWNKYISQYD